MTTLRWIIGFIVSIVIVLILLLLFPDISDKTGFCIILIGFTITVCYSAIKTSRLINELKSTREHYSKTDWIVIERRIFGLEMLIIADISVALMCTGICIYEIIQVFT